MNATGYFAPEGLEEVLKKELKGITAVYDRLIIAEGPPQNVHFFQNIWYEVEILHFNTISEGAALLRERQKLWSFYPYKNIRRGELIREKLPYFSPKPIIFPSKLPTSPLGSFTLLDQNVMLVSKKCSSPFAGGEVIFNENKTVPGRAYLKLWELFLRSGRMPKEGDKCLEVGASPGSWTYVLANLGAEVIAVDKAPLDPEIAAMKSVTFLKKDAFSLKPEDFEGVTWLFSDVICYPEKLLEWIHLWLEKKPNLNLVCTLKFQGEDGYGVLDEFEKIQGGHLIHLFNNKHEMTWYKNDS